MFSRSSSAGLKLFIAIVFFLMFLYIIRRLIPYEVHPIYLTALRFMEIVAFLVFVAVVIFFIIDYLSADGFNRQGPGRI